MRVCHLLSWQITELVCQFARMNYSATLCRMQRSITSFAANLDNSGRNARPSVDSEITSTLRLLVACVVVAK